VVRLTKNKKAVFFTFTAILMMSVFLLSFFVYNEYRMRNKALVIETRISSMDDFIQDIKTDIERGLYISSFRSVLAMTEYISIQHNNSYTYLNNTNAAFQEVFFNGTINGQEMGLIKNNTFPIWEERVKEQATKTDIEIYFFKETASIDQTSPWKVRVTLTFTLGVGDIKSTSYWSKDMQIETFVNITNFEDPIYRIGTRGKVLNAIKPKTVPFFVIGNDTANLKTHTEESRYIPCAEAPSFLKRLQGNFSADPQGIESLVNVGKLKSQPGLNPIENKTVVDYLYFDNSKNPTSWEITNISTTWTWFRLDNESNGASQRHHEVYNVTGLIS